MSEQQASYRQIMKATSLFGGIQVFNILIAIIRSKFIAVLLGPAGMGVMGLLSSTTGLIAGLTNFGLGTSAVKSVAEADRIGNAKRTALIIKVLRRWVWVTGLVGMIVTIVTAPLLSQLTFGNYDYAFPFIWISISLLFSQLSSGELAVLQGLRKLQMLAKANLLGSILGLTISIPLYYWLGNRGIVPAIILSSFIILFCSWFFVRKIDIESIEVSRIRTFAEGKDMLVMGFMISLSSIITLGTSYIVRIFISHYGGVEQVGLFNAGFAIINMYVGLVFTAMATDYFPRLSAVAHDNIECNKVINQQAEISILIIAPIIVSFLVFIHWIVVLLYSQKFISINTMLLWAALGMIFKAASWAIAFVFVSKGATRLFFWNELIANIYVLILNIVGYYYGGLTGLGVSFLIGYFLYLIQVFVIANLRYNFNFQSETRIIFTVQLLIVLFSFISSLLFENSISYVVGSGLFILSFWYSYRELDKRIGIKSLIVSKFMPFKKS